MNAGIDSRNGTLAGEYIGDDLGASPTGAPPTDTPGSQDLLSPSAWFAQRFPSLAAEFGEPLRSQANANGHERVVDLNESYLAATLGAKGNPDAPVVYDAIRGEFFEYVRQSDDKRHGTYVPITSEALCERFSRLLLDCARESESSVETTALEFPLRSTRRLKGVVERAKAVLAVSSDFWLVDSRSLLACANGMLRLEDFELLPFSPDYHCRGKLGVSYDPSADCPIFLGQLLGPALDEEDRDLLQRWMGLALCGLNLAQVVMLFVGTAGGGKGTIVRVIGGILGKAQLASLRIPLLTSRFEIARLLGRSLLYGADVKPNFLHHDGASTLKALTGGDPVTVEFKGSNSSHELICRFNVLLTANSRLRVQLEGDHDAWRRRLRIICFEQPATHRPIADLSEQIVAKEGPGVLNFMLEGLAKLRTDVWLIPLSDRQRTRVDDLLAESDSVRQFFTDKGSDIKGQPLTIERAFACYLSYCGKRGWTPLSRVLFARMAADVVGELYHLPVRHDVADNDGPAQRGWVGISIK